MCFCGLLAVLYSSGVDTSLGILFQKTHLWVVQEGRVKQLIWSHWFEDLLIFTFIFQSQATNSPHRVLYSAQHDTLKLFEL